MVGIPKGRRIAGILVLALIAGVIAYVAYVRHDNRATWSHVRSQAAAFTPPAHWTFIGRAEQGSAACIVSCDTPRVTLVFRATASPTDACPAIRAKVDSEIGRTTVDPYSGEDWCPWFASLPSTGGGHVKAGAALASKMRGQFAPSWTSKVTPTGYGTLAWVEFSGGLH